MYTLFVQIYKLQAWSRQELINYVIIVDTKGSSTAYYYPFLQYLGKRLVRGRYSTATEETKARWYYKG